MQNPVMTKPNLAVMASVGWASTQVGAPKGAGRRGRAEARARELRRRAHAPRTERAPSLHRGTLQHDSRTRQRQTPVAESKRRQTGANLDRLMRAATHRRLRS